MPRPRAACHAAAIARNLPRLLASSHPTVPQAASSGPRICGQAPRSVTSKSLGRTPQFTAVPPSIVHLHGSLLLRCTRIILSLPCRTRSLVGTSPSEGTSTIRGQLSWAGPGRQRLGKGLVGIPAPRRRSSSSGDISARLRMPRTSGSTAACSTREQVEHITVSALGRIVQGE